MKVGIVCPYTWNVPGGVQQHIRDLAEALIGFGHHVSVMTPADDDAPLPPYVVSAGRAVPVPYNGSVARLAFGFLSAGRVRRWINEGEFDVLHVHEPAAPSLGLLACWAADGPIVGTFHASYEKSRVVSVTAPILQSALEKITGRIAVSEAARKTLVAHLGGDAVLIPNGVATERYAMAEPLPGWPGRLEGDHRRSPLPAPPGGVGGRPPSGNADGDQSRSGGGTLGFLGRMDEPRKGLQVLLKAFEILGRQRPGLRLLVAGPGDADDAIAKVSHELRDRVVLLGMVSEEDKIRAYHSVDVFVAPNLGGESFGIVLAEAMSAGAPILASDIEAFDRVLLGGRAGALFPVGEPEALAAAAGELLDDPARRKHLSAEARAAVRAYDWSSVARDVLRVYETVALGSGGVVESGALA
ncbi:glycosyltransferase family 4 protein [Actinomadura barringtoniae]|uniref:Glycosyltransferase family 4 protein n=1 Tax=Actinomadura barringtoniae TaxID=1427535 RepID=A0A939T759_9ACTN|nr:glycosyltransferase family 4 protein [Actinomadura barringtoniae]MBO2452753.1 glycosyltransferase family 4 protein [Actinomadura barringtoniae]